MELAQLDGYIGKDIFHSRPSIDYDRLDNETPAFEFPPHRMEYVLRFAHDLPQKDIPFRMRIPAYDDAVVSSEVGCVDDKHNIGGNDIDSMGRRPVYLLSYPGNAS